MGTHTYKLYYKQGSLDGFNTDSSAWTLACSESTTYDWTGYVYDNTGSADYSGITDESQCAFTIPAGQMYAVYIHGISRGLVTNSEGTSFDDVVASDNYLSVFTGLGVFSGGVFSSGYGNDYYITPTVRIFYSASSSISSTQSPEPSTTDNNIVSTTQSPDPSTTDSNTLSTTNGVIASTNAISTTDTKTSIDNELTVTTEFSTGVGGIMFDVTAGPNHVSIDELMFKYNGGSDATQTYKLFYKQGSLEGFNTDSSAWTLACSGSTTSIWNGVYNSNTGNADYSGITDASQCAFTVPAGQTYGVYIHGISRSLVVQKEGTSLDDIVAIYNHLAVHTGLGVFSGGVFSSGYGNNYFVTPTVRLFYSVSISTTQYPDPSTTISNVVSTTNNVITSSTQLPDPSTTDNNVVSTTQSVNPSTTDSNVMSTTRSVVSTTGGNDVSTSQSPDPSTTVLVTDTFTTIDEAYCDDDMVRRKKFVARMERRLSNNIFDPKGCQFCLCQEIGQSVCNNLFDFASWDQTIYEEVFNELCPMNDFADLMNENGEQCDWMQIRVKDESDITECGCSAFYCQDEAFNGSGANGLQLSNVLMVVALVTFGVWM